MIQPEIFNRLLSTAPVTLVVLVMVPLCARPDRLHRTAADRCPRVASSPPILLLALPRRRRDHLRELLFDGARAARWRCRRSPTPSSPSPTAPTRGSPAPRWPRSASCLGINLVVTLEPAPRAGVRLAADAAVPVGSGGDRLAAGGDRADDDRRLDDARDRPPLRRCLLRPRRGRRAAPARAPRLRLLHGRLPDRLPRGRRRHLEILPTFSCKPIFSHRAVASLVRRDRRPRPARVDAEHVLGAPERGLDDHGDGLRARPHRPDRRPVLRLGRDDLGRHA